MDNSLMDYLGKMLKLTERQAKQATVMRHMTQFQVLSSQIEEAEAK